MNEKRKGILGATVLVLLVGLLGSGTVLPSLAQDGPPPIAVEVLTERAELTDDVRAQFNIKLDGCATEVLNLKDPSRTVVAKITVRPGAQFPWDTHPGLVLGNVAQGQLVYVSVSDGVERPYAAGSVFGAALLARPAPLP